MRLIPWLSTPRRSADTRQKAMMVAWVGETPLPSRMDWVKALAFPGLTLRVGFEDSVEDMVKLRMEEEEFEDELGLAKILC